jgi:membrane-anchored protein YejM (alkaline phosphatase superfamily)
MNSSVDNLGIACLVLALLVAISSPCQSENTLVIWCADHGDALASHGGLWGKSATYIEEVARIPMAIRWPARFKGAKRTDKVISNMDITATILQAAGIKLPGYMHSRSLLDLCRAGDGVDWPEYTVAEHHGHLDKITQRILVVLNFQDSGETVEIDLSGVNTTKLVELKSGQTVEHQDVFKVKLPAYGYRFYQVLPAKTLSR